MVSLGIREECPMEFIHGERGLKPPSHGRMINNCGVMQYGLASIKCTYAPINQSCDGPLLREKGIKT